MGYTRAATFNGKSGDSHGALSNYLRMDMSVEFEEELTMPQWSIPRNRMDEIIVKAQLELTHFKVQFWDLGYPLKTTTLSKVVPIEGLKEANFIDALVELGAAKQALIQTLTLEIGQAKTKKQ